MTPCSGANFIKWFAPSIVSYRLFSDQRVNTHTFCFYMVMICVLVLSLQMICMSNSELILRYCNSYWIFEAVYSN
jgi:hypothetical protein